MPSSYEVVRSAGSKVIPASVPGGMRTTIRLDETLLGEAKRVAAEQGMTLTAIIEESLRERLARNRAVPHRPPTRLSTVGAGGVLPGIDLDDSASLFDAMGERT